VGRRKLRRVSRVEELRAIVDGGSDLLDGQRLQFARERLIQRRPHTAVQHGVVGEVRRRIRLIRGHELDEALLRHRLERVIHTPLIPDGRYRFLRDCLAAQRPGAMRGINLCRVRQRQQLFMQRVVQHGAQLSCRPAERCAEIRSSHVADKQCVARKHRDRAGIRDSGLGIRDQSAVVHEQRNRFDRMPRRFQSLDPDRSEIDHRAVANRLEFIFRDRFPTEADDRAHAVAQLEVAGNEIRVEVRQEDVRDTKVVIGRERQILIDVALRIDDSRGTALLISNDVRGVCETVEIKLLEEHMSIMPESGQ